MSTESFMQTLNDVIGEAIDSVPHIRVENICHVCRYREFAIIRGFSVDWMQVVVEAFLRAVHPHSCKTICSDVGLDSEIMPAFEALPY